MYIYNSITSSYAEKPLYESKYVMYNLKNLAEMFLPEDLVKGTHTAEMNTP